MRGLSHAIAFTRFLVDAMRDNRKRMHVQPDTHTLNSHRRHDFSGGVAPLFLAIRRIRRNLLSQASLVLAVRGVKCQPALVARIFRADQGWTSSSALVAYRSGGSCD